jgi:hypothetical protein
MTMLDSIQFAEIFAQSKRDDIERNVARGRLLAQIGERGSGLRVRQAIAGALVRLATIIDAGAGAHKPAGAH